jgi:hypothetical protein
MENLDVKKLIPVFEHDDGARDNMLNNYFIDTRYYNELPDDGSVIIVGRYGSGKTTFLQQLVKKRKEKDKNIRVVPITLRADLFVEELQEVKRTRDYSTFSRALIYLHILYSLALETSGKLKLGKKGLLVDELNKLELSPYSDIITQFSNATWRTLRSVKKVEASQIFSVEKDSATQHEITMRRYRELCLKFEPLIREVLLKHKILIVIDALDAISETAIETANLVGNLIVWLLDEESQSENNLQCLVALPSNLLRVYRSQGGHIPAQNVFITIDWDDDELEELISARFKKALDASIDVNQWLEKNVGINLSNIHQYTFSRPRDYVKLVRKCLIAKDSHPKFTAKKCWEQGLKKYSTENIAWLQSEWQLDQEGFEELVALLQSFPPSFSEKTLKDGINEIRNDGKLTKLSANRIISELKRWKLISEQIKGKKKSLVTHPLLQTSVYFE